MELRSGKRNKQIVCLYEAIGTGFVVYTSLMGKVSIEPNCAVVFTIFALILVIGPVTGAHFNPAVTLAVYIQNVDWRQDWAFCIQIMVAEFAGGIWGMCLAWMSLYNEEGAANEKTWAQVAQRDVVR
jgi:glycerol uptake facilitator-like aquaporin